jgi:hypothetical protein
MAATPAFAVDVNPFDWMPAPDGTTAVFAYTPWSHDDKAVINGNKIDASLNSAIVMPRLIHYFEIGNHPAAVTALLPMGRLWNGSLGGTDLGSRTSVGDLTLAGAYWALSAPQERRNLAIVGYLNVPLGAYDRDKALNISTGAFNATLQVGNMVALSEKITLETTADVSFYQKKNNANTLGQTLKQDNSYSLQNWLSYGIGTATTVSAGHAFYFGGAQHLDGISNGLNAEKQQVKMGITHWLTPTFCLYGQINQDFDVKGGFKGTSGMLRFAKIL